MPAGDYYVQALLNIYTEFHRADGHVIWAHMDQWEGQQFSRSPGNLYSEVRKVHLDAARGYSIRLETTKIAGRRFTTLAAVAAFLERCSEASSPGRPAMPDSSAAST